MRLQEIEKSVARFQDSENLCLEDSGFHSEILVRTEGDRGCVVRRGCIYNHPRSRVRVRNLTAICVTVEQVVGDYFPVKETLLY